MKWLLLGYGVGVAYYAFVRTERVPVFVPGHPGAMANVHVPLIDAVLWPKLLIRDFSMPTPL